MKIDVITIFPEMVDVPLSMSIIGKAREKGLLDLKVHDLRKYSRNKHNCVDDTPYGGGPGMVMKPEPFFNAIEELALKDKDTRVILMSPKGNTLNQNKVNELSKIKKIVILCGHYEGIDERVKELIVDEELSIGDYILTGGEIAAMVLVDAVTRLIPGVLGHQDSPKTESFSEGLLEYPQYTKPREFKGLKVPEVLLSGNHAKIDLWRRTQALSATATRRPDLLKTAKLTKEDKIILEEIQRKE